MDVKVYRLEELESHLHTSFSRPTGALSMSPLRLASYLNNPRAKAADVVLIEMHHQGKVLAYRTLLPDHFISKADRIVRFAWLSGNWVHPEFRRKGISTRLLQSAEKAWGGKLMYTNYAPASKAVYDQSKSFSSLAIREGKRFYLRAASEELLGKRMGGSSVFRSCDRVINSIREKNLLRLGQKLPQGCSVEKLFGFDAELLKVIDKTQEKSLFRRDAELFNWAMKFPWITDKEVPHLEYHFSYKARRFENVLLSFRHGDTGSMGMLWLIIHNQVLSVPYVIAECEEIYSAMAKYILKTMISSGSTHATLHCKELVKSLLPFKRHFLMVRNMPQHIFAHTRLEELIPTGLKIHDGDGDVMFTG